MKHAVKHTRRHAVKHTHDDTHIRIHNYTESHSVAHIYTQHTHKATQIQPMRKRKKEKKRMKESRCYAKTAKVLYFDQSICKNAMLVILYNRYKSRRNKLF